MAHHLCDQYPHRAACPRRRAARAAAEPPEPLDAARPGKRCACCVGDGRRRLPTRAGTRTGLASMDLRADGAGLSGFTLLVARQRQRTRAGRSTLVTASLFGKRAFVAGVSTGLALVGALMGLSIVFTLLAQVGLGWSPLKAGLAGIPQAIGMVLGFIASQPLGARWGGRRVMHAGEALVLAGLTGFITTLHVAGDGIVALALAPALAVLGTGFGMTMAPSSTSPWPASMTLKRAPRRACSPRCSSSAAHLASRPWERCSGINSRSGPQPTPRSVPSGRRHRPPSGSLSPSSSSQPC